MDATLIEINKQQSILRLRQQFTN